MTTVERQLLTDLRHALLHLHKTLLDAERITYERTHGRRTPAGELLKVIVSDPQFAWLRPFSELIVRIDEALETEDWAEGPGPDVEAIVMQAWTIVAPDENGPPNARRYHAALQAEPDAVLAHREVTTILKGAPSSGRTH